MSNPTGKEWWGRRELVGLPGMPKNVKHIARDAKKLGLERRKKQGPGGGYEYRFDSLPTITQGALIREHAGKPKPVEHTTEDAKGPPAPNTDPVYVEAVCGEVELRVGTAFALGALVALAGVALGALLF